MSYRVLDMWLTFNISTTGTPTQKQYEGAHDKFDTIWPRRSAPAWKNLICKIDDTEFRQQVNKEVEDKIKTLSPIAKDKANATFIGPLQNQIWKIGSNGVHTWGAIQIQYKIGAQIHAWKEEYDYENQQQTQTTGTLSVLLEGIWRTYKTLPDPSVIA